jgi:hypothetical protein
MYLTSNAFIQFHLQDLEEIRRQDRKYAKKHGIPINTLVKSLKSKIQGLIIFFCLTRIIQIGESQTIIYFAFQTRRQLNH